MTSDFSNQELGNLSMNHQVSKQKPYFANPRSVCTKKHSVMVTAVEHVGWCERKSLIFL